MNHHIAWLSIQMDHRAAVERARKYGYHSAESHAARPPRRRRALSLKWLRLRALRPNRPVSALHGAETPTTARVSDPEIAVAHAARW